MVNALRLFLAGITGIYMLLDGSYARATQTYIAGVTGPWAGIMHLVGLNAHSTVMYTIFIVYGIAWLGAIALYVMRQPQWLFVMAVLTLWYVPFGAILAIGILGTYLRPAPRA